MTEPTDKDRNAARAFIATRRFYASRGDDVLEAAVEDGASMRAAGRNAERAWHRKYLERTLKMSKHVPGSAMLRAFLESTLEHLAKEDGST